MNRGLLTTARAAAEAGQTEAAEDGRPRDDDGRIIPAAEAEAIEGAKLGARMRRREAAKNAAHTEAALESAETGRRVTWQGGTIDARRYGAADLAALTEAAATAAAAAGRRGRLVKGPDGPRRVGRVTLSDGDRESLAAEAVVMVLAAQAEAAETGAEADRAEAAAYSTDRGSADLADRLPRRGGLTDLAPEGLREVAEGRRGEAVTWTPDGAAEAVTLDRGDLTALTGLLTGLLRADREQPWRDCAEALRAAESGGPVDAEAVSVAGDGGLTEAAPLAAAEAEAVTAPPQSGGRLTAEADPYIGPNLRAWPLAAETEATLYLSGLTRRQRAAVAEALTGTGARATGRTWASLRDGQGAASPTAWRTATDKGRKALRAALADPDKRAETARRLADLAEAEDGPRAERTAAADLAEARAESCPSGPASWQRAARACREAAPDTLAERLRRVYGERSGGRLADLRADLAAARTAAERACLALNPDTEDGREAEALTAARQRVADLAAALRAAESARPRPLTGAERAEDRKAADAAEARRWNAAPAPAA